MSKKMQTVKECIKYVYEPDSKEERKKRLCQLVAKWLMKNATKNKMEFISAMFGKKLCEEFTVSVPRYEFGKVKDKVLVKGWFGSRGFQSEQIDIADSYIFAELLEGEAVIVDE